MSKESLTLIVNGVLALALIVLMGMGHMPPAFGILALVALAVPSSAPQVLGWLRDVVQRDQKPDNGPPGPSVVFLFLALGWAVHGCTPQQQAALVAEAAAKVACALANQDLPDEQIVGRCVLSAEQREHALEVVHEERARRASEAAAAHTRGYSEARRACEAAQ